MSEWAMKRFWDAASIEKTGSGFAVVLDGRPVKTPAKRALSVPTELMAQRIADEWDAQGKTVDPASMPWTRSANAAIDKVATQHREVTDHLAGYAETDLLCYRADGPQALRDRQSEAWDPMLGWVRDTYGARLLVTSGVMPVLQGTADIDRLAAVARDMSIFQLTGFHDLVTLSGSFVIALAATESLEAPESLWSKSRIDEAWQIEQWGEDEEAAEHANIKKSAFFHAIEFFHAA
jgi:chaperone required for assembly of F1-ATPase